MSGLIPKQIGLCLILAKGPPRTTFDYVFNQNTVISLTNESFVTYTTFLLTDHTIDQTNE